MTRMWELGVQHERQRLADLEERIAGRWLVSATHHAHLTRRLLEQRATPAAVARAWAYHQRTCTDCTPEEPPP